jgi:uncharacterized protein YjbI with pentapeptide repeats
MWLQNELTYNERTIMLKNIENEKIDELVECHENYLDDKNSADGEEFDSEWKDLKLELGDFSKCDLKGAKFIEDRLDGMNFEGSDLTGAHFERCSLRKAFFKDCICKNAVFFDCWMEGASFYGADCKDADFTDTELNDANFFQADIRGADFQWADISGSMMQDVKIDKNVNPMNFLNMRLEGIKGNEQLKKWLEQQVYDASVINNYLKNHRKKEN